MSASTWSERLAAYQDGDQPLFSAPTLDRWGGLTWAPSKADENAAGELHTQITSRIATNALGYAEGIEASALESLRLLFEHARSAAERNAGANHFDALAWDVLNRHVRPFTARWHRRREAGLLRALDATDDFRAELIALQQVLRRFDDFLLELRDGYPPPPLPAQASDSGLAVEMAATLAWGIGADGGVDPVTAERIDVAEREAVSRRRLMYDLPMTAHASGLAISGGGIRSATFSLGVLAGLAKRGLLARFDYLSTVSGGGYLGGFLTTFLSADEAVEGVGLARGQLPFRREDGEAAALRYVRHHARYLQSSIAERLAIGSSYATGAAINIAAVSVIVVFAAVLDLLTHGVLDALDPAGRGLRLVGYAIWSASLLPALLSRRLPATRRRSDQVSAWCAGAACVLLAWAALGGAHAAFTALSRRGWADAGVIGVTAPFALACLAASGAIGASRRRDPRVRRFVEMVAGVSAPVLLLNLELSVYAWLEAVRMPGSPAAVVARVSWALASAAVGGGVMLLAVDVNFTAPHRHYRRKIAEAFLIRPSSSTRPDALLAAAPLKLSAGAASARGPYPIFNCALNVPASRDPAMQGRLVDFFMFSPAFTGSPLVGYQGTSEWEAADPDLDVATAVAISGGAAAPSMGLATKGYLRPWLALLNVRLGYWLRRPGRNGTADLRLLFREMTGDMNEEGALLNLTDGGHVENLGVYELLRRRCKFIVAVDGEEDPSMTFHGLANLQRLAAIDLGASIDIDLDDLRLSDSGFSRSHFRFCRVRYRPRPGETRAIGYLLYAKLSLTGNEGEFLRRFRLDEPAFPHDPTTNQFFSESQFEAYRSLGEHIGDKLFQPAIVGSLSEGTSVAIEDWFEAIAHAMLRPL